MLLQLWLTTWASEPRVLTLSSAMYTASIRLGADRASLTHVLPPGISQGVLSDMYTPRLLVKKDTNSMMMSSVLSGSDSWYPELF